jgi:hypothetical protein
MATARELLEQADALMRRNRLRDDVTAAVPVGDGAPMVIAVPAIADFPVLTEVVDVAGSEWDIEAAPGGDVVFVEAGDAAPVPPPASGDHAQLTEIDNASVRTDVHAVPVLTDAVGDFESEVELSSLRAIADGANEGMRGPEVDDDERPSTLDASVRAASPIDGDVDAARWNSLAEEVRMQVLQRIDIFTDTGLQEQLTARLQPIVDRASADLVAAINQHVGQLLRTYVAEAIEREIETWRHGGG